NDAMAAFGRRFILKEGGEDDVFLKWRGDALSLLRWRYATATNPWDAGYRLEMEMTDALYIERTCYDARFLWPRFEGQAPLLQGLGRFLDVVDEEPDYMAAIEKAAKDPWALDDVELW